MATLNINQIELMAAICKEIGKQQVGDIPADHEIMNACIEAANMVKDKLQGFNYTPIKPTSGITK